MEAIVITLGVATILLAPLGVVMLDLLAARRWPDRRGALLLVSLAVIAAATLLVWVWALAETHDVSGAFMTMVAMVFSAGSLIAAVAAWLCRGGATGVDPYAARND